MNMSSPGRFSPKRAKPVPAPSLVLIEPFITDAFRAAVRGERPVKDLTTAGTAAHAAKGTAKLLAADVAEGIINLKNDPSALSEWANFILASSAASKASSTESDYWDRLLSGVWAIALGTGPKDSVIALAYAIRTRQSLA